MKKSLSLLFALMLTLAVNAQVFLDQTFDGSSLPSGWSFAGEGKNSMLLNGSNYAGGSPYEVAVASSNQGLPDFDGYARVVSPVCDFTGIGEFLFSFKYMLNVSPYVSSISPMQIGIAASDDNGSTWTDLWSQTKNTDAGPVTINQTISIPEGMDESNVKLCVYIKCYAPHLWIMVFDDIRALIQKENDIAVTSINVSDVIGLGENEVSFTVKNNGSKAITALTASYQFEGYEEVAQNFSTYMAPFTTKNLTFDVPTNITGLNPIKLNVSAIAVNNTTDDNEADNSLEKEVSVAWGTTQRIPMIEHFSSSTCGLCVSVNASMKSLTANNPGKYTYTKYAVNWPGTGDNHYTAECRTRVQYYQVGGVPAMYLDGMDKGTPINQSTLNSRYETPALADVRGAFNIDGNTLNVTADFMSYADMNVKAFVTVNEKVIEKNGANGEREFHHIMLKMLGGAQGTAVDLKAGEYQRLTFTHDMSTTKMQDINDLEVSLWLQNLSTGEIFNSHYAYEYTDHCYPVQNLELNTENGNINITFEAPEQGTPTGYNVYNNGTLIAENTNEMSFTVTADAINIISVVAMYEDDKTSIAIVKGAGAGLGVEETAQVENTFSIYPNPARDYVRVSGENINSISVYNCLGALVERIEAKGNTTSISTSDYNTGVYFITVEQNNGASTTQKMVVTH